MAKKKGITKQQKAKRLTAYREKVRGQKITAGLQNAFITVGPRYVFFKSLEHRTGYYSQLWAIGQSYLEQARAALDISKLKENGNEYQLNRMNQYINFIRSMGTTESQNLEQFIQQLKAKLGPLQSEELNKLFADFENDPNNYQTILTLLNTLIKKNNWKQNKIENIYTESMKFIAEQTEKLDQQTKKKATEDKKTIQQLFYTNVHSYNIEIAKIINSVVQDNNFKITYATLLSNRINGTIEEFINDDKFLQMVEQQYLNNQKANPQQLATKIVSFITNTLSDFSYDMLQKNSKIALADYIKAQLTKKRGILNSLSEKFVNNINNQLEKRKATSIEQLVLTTGKGTTRFLQELHKDQRDKILDQYFPKNSENTKINDTRKYIEDTIAKLSKNSATTKEIYKSSLLLNKQIKDNLKEKLGEQIITEIEEKVITADQALIKINNASSALKAALSIQLSGSGVSEILGEKQFANLVGNALQSSQVYGNKIKLKNDLFATVNFNQASYSQNLQFNQYLKNITIDFQPSFVKEYVSLADGAEDVGAAMKAYTDQVQNLLKKIDYLEKNNTITHEERENYLKSLSDYLMVGISIKDYNYAGNLGFHGGTLGANLQSVVNNITQMYQLGGISNNDQEMLYFAIANCGPELIASDLKESIQVYLAGAAAIMMFDDGFTAAESFLSQMRQILGSDGFFKGLHLFRVNGKLVPSSIVYNTIANSLEQVMNNLNGELNSIMQSGGNSVHINNNINENRVSFDEYPDPQSRWDAMSQYANGVLSGSNISFTFLGGLLDILQQIPQAFNI